MTDAKTYDCPSPDCGKVFGAVAELSDHIRESHPGEYQRDDWPDTPAGRATRDDDRDDSEE